MPKISAIVTTFNRKEFLTETVNAILNQTYADFELIIVDNYSNYHFFGLIESFNDKRIKAYQNQNNGVIAINRNVGIQHATGEYLAFCDDDDIWLPKKLNEQINFVENNNLKDEKIVLYSNSIEFKEDGSNSVTKKKKIITSKDLIKSNEVSFSSSFFSNNLNNLKFNELPEFFAVEDYIFWMQLNLSGFTFHLQEEALIRYRVLKTSSSALNYGVNHLRIIIAITYISINKKLKFKNQIQVFKSIFINVLKYLAKRILKEMNLLSKKTSA